MGYHLRGPTSPLLCGPARGKSVLLLLGDARCLPALSFHTPVQPFLAARKGWVSGLSRVFMPFWEIRLLYLKPLLLQVILAGKSPLMLSFVEFLLLNPQCGACSHPLHVRWAPSGGLYWTPFSCLPELQASSFGEGKYWICPSFVIWAAYGGVSPATALFTLPSPAL